MRYIFPRLIPLHIIGRRLRMCLRLPLHGASILATAAWLLHLKQVATLFVVWLRGREPTTPQPLQKRGVLPGSSLPIKLFSMNVEET